MRLKSESVGSPMETALEGSLEAAVWQRVVVSKREEN